MSNWLQKTTDARLPQEFVEVFNIMKPEPDYFHLILIPIHWGLASCGLDLVDDKSESMSLSDIYERMITTADGIRCLDLHYLSHLGLLWKLKVTETIPDEKTTLIGVPLKQKKAVWNWKTPKKYILDLSTYIKDLDGDSAEEIYNQEAIESFGSLLMRDLNGKRVLRSHSSSGDSNASGELGETLTQGESGANPEDDYGDDKRKPMRSKRMKTCE
ncbi:unnamed protein product [Orchesella dallaii]|uniref:Uncharacterized protein n=1 Tax=Orchesella dallaii TaxID=48710 RepID=A0ABP1RDV2_9HEXA